MLSSQRPINFTRCFIKHEGKYHFAMFEEGIDCFRLNDKTTINYNRVEMWLNEKVSDVEMYHELVESIEKLCNIPPVIKSVCDHPQFDILGCPFDNQECEKCQYFPSQTVL